MITPSPEPLAPFDEIVRSFLLHHGLLPENGHRPSFDEWAIGLSGGGDSIFLLHLLLRHRPSHFRIQLLHFDHHTEETRNLSDRIFLTEISKSLELPLLLGESPSPEKSRSGVSETVLRQERQTFFEHYLSDHPHSALFLGHQADDRIETILSNLFQGGGPRSLIGISPTTGNRTFRPILTIRRDDIREALNLANIPYVNDPSNQDTSHLRNRIRHNLRPFLDQFFPPHGTRHLEHLAFLMEREIPALPPDHPLLLCEEESEGHIRFSLFLYRSLKPSLQGLFLRWLMNRQAGYGLPVPPERNLLRTLQEIRFQTENRPFPLGQEWYIHVVLGRAVLVYQYSEFWTQKIAVPNREGENLRIRLPRGGTLSVLRLSAEEVANHFLGRSPGMSCLIHASGQPEEGDRTLDITYWRPGLHILPGKEDRNPLLVSSLWRSRKIPEVYRRRWPILCQGQSAVWMPGLFDRSSLLDPRNNDVLGLLTYQERERSEWKKFLGNP